jgi:hypothetical protein
MILHLQLHDGAIKHEALNRASIAAAVANFEVHSWFSHEDGACPEPEVRIVPGVLLKREPLHLLRTPIDWPPTEPPVTPQTLSEMTGLCLMDCQAILWSWSGGNLPKVEPREEKDGQFSLF